MNLYTAKYITGIGMEFVQSNGERPPEEIPAVLHEVPLGDVEAAPERTPVDEVREVLQALNGPVLDVLRQHIPDQMHHDLIVLSYVVTQRAAKSVGLDPADFIWEWVQP